MASYQSRAVPSHGIVRRRDAVYRTVTRLLAVLLAPIAAVVTPGRARHTACQWALTMRFPAENLAGLTPGTRAAFEAARTRALWRYGELLGLTSGHRDAATQAALYAAEVERTGSEESARQWTLPPDESRHVAGLALDVRPSEGARWLEEYGAPYGLYRTYDNEWWHFEYHPEGRPTRRAHPDIARAGSRSGSST
ncbi:D-alanyl-D-alanine carboxypeptidase family protein [Dactylosporangium sp. AC04546]|uniref:D-alanyl-D-alanine carboxypeptidase family protein n=1 Tax=Dactylosporangium sp. AC04546 TaxID=2862460 RepID=UPI001EDF01D5|nr:D-alanyl-D-alanine carboxypeptidase family protein [Dactylosporangium sp. AC04546]WVK87021.1 D-alanyl-D-alanine carboxypeptidase family protein [Dactylosporangium sp. AC04546]